ncbi:MAG: class I SAM-dependent methyltransferase [Acidimicrobiales bacterium]
MIRSLPAVSLDAIKDVDHCAPGFRPVRDATVLDVGCGQGTQALRLARNGHAVTCVDPSEQLLERLWSSASAIDLPPNVIRGSIATLSRRVARDGRFSFTFRNGDALAFRPGLRRDWSGVKSAFDAKTSRLCCQPKRRHVDEIRIAPVLHRSTCGPGGVRAAASARRASSGCARSSFSTSLGSNH